MEKLLEDAGVKLSVVATDIFGKSGRAMLDVLIAGERDGPGNDKTGAKSKPAHTAPGDRWLKAALGTAAMGAIRTKNSYTHALFRRVSARRGGKRAQAAVAHSLLVAIWHILTSTTPYQDLGADYFLTRDNPDHRRRRAIAQLQGIGYHVTLEPDPG
jgi:hypothetical protein